MSKVLSALGGALPDERPVLSLQIVESVAKCPTGYWPVSRTYDEDSDAGLLKQNGLFGKKPSHYICLSKSEGVPGYVMDGVMVVGEREAVPAGYSVAGRAGKRRLCTRVSRHGAALNVLVTDIIVCSKMRQAPQGFQLAGEINGKVVCYKMSGGSPDTSPQHKINDYENVVSHVTPEANRRLRVAPERPPKWSPLISELNNMSVKSPALSDDSSHDYEALSPAYSVRVARPAPRPPNGERNHGSPAARVALPLPRPCFPTLGTHSALEGVPFTLNPKLRGLPDDQCMKLPVIKRRTIYELDREYSYNFALERQT